MTPIRLSLAAATLTGSLAAQCPPERLEFGPIDCDAATGVGLNLGCQFLNGEIFVSGAAGSASGPYTIFVLDTSGTLLRSFAQPAAITSGFGLRDGATDGTNLFFGNEQGIFAFDVNGGAVTTIEATNGTQTPSFPITGPGLATNGNYRGLAFDPDGDGGNGSFFTGSFGTDILEIDLAGNVLTTFTNGGQWSAYGLALVGNELWVNDDGPGNLVAIDKRVGLLNGKLLRAAVGVPGGLSTGPDDSLVWVSQGTPDQIAATGMPLFATPAYDMLTGVDGVRDASISEINTASATFSYDLGAPPGTMYQAYLNAFPESVLCSDTRDVLGWRFEPLLQGLRNFYAASLFSAPSTPKYAEFPGVAGAPIVLTAPPLVASVVPDGLVRVQALYLDMSGPPEIIPVRTSTEGLWNLNSLPPVGVTVAADGGNSFNRRRASGFWSITNNSTDPNQAITKVVLDFTVNFATQEFDTNQTNMRDLFEGGNSTRDGCAGTYRNGSDVATGLVYDGSNTEPANACDPTANTGWIGTNPGNSAGDWRTLEFNFVGGAFVNGATFEFDADTDNEGISGDAMAGLVVTITFADGSTRAGALAVSGGERAEVSL